MVISNKQKGTKHEKEVQKILENQGYLVMRSPRTMRPLFIKGRRMYVSQDNDFFNLWDIVGKKDKNTLWIQVKSNPKHISEPKKPIEDFFKKYCCAHETCQIWLRVPKKGFVIYTLTFNHHGKTAVIDGKTHYEFGDLIWIKEFINLKGEKIEPFKITGD